MNSKKYILFALLLSSTMVCAQQKKAKPVARKNARNPATANPMNARQQENFNAMLPNTQSIFVVDSTIVDKNRVVETIPLSPKYGKFVSYNSFFDTDTQPNQYVFINGFANKCYYTELGKDSVQHLYTRNKLGDGWGEPHRISEIDSKLKHISYPFLSSDGQTLYVSGIADDGLGKRDIYVAKYNADEGTYFEPENIGLPFNSHDDDLSTWNRMPNASHGLPPHADSPKAKRAYMHSPCPNSAPTTMLTRCRRADSRAWHR